MIVTPDRPDAATLGEYLVEPLVGYEQAAVVAARWAGAPQRSWIFRRVAAPAPR